MLARIFHEWSKIRCASCELIGVRAERAAPPLSDDESLLLGRKEGHQKLLTTEHVERREAVVIIVSVEEPSPLGAVSLDVGRVEVQN